MPAAPPTSLPPTRLLPFTHGTLIQSWKTLWWKIGSPSAVEIDIQNLSGIIGIRADRTGPMTMSDREGMVVFTRWTIDETPKANPDGDEVLFSIPAGSVLGSVRYADEVAPGVFAWVQTMGESAQYFRTDRSTPIDANLSEFNIKFVERNPDTGHIVLIGDAIHDWDVDGTGALITPPLPATSEGYAPWNIARRAVALSERSMPNPNAEQLSGRLSRSRNDGCPRATLDALYRSGILSASWRALSAGGMAIGQPSLWRVLLLAVARRRYPAFARGGAAAVVGGGHSEQRIQRYSAVKRVSSPPNAVPPDLPVRHFA
jgi:hypothetical protein